MFNLRNGFILGLASVAIATTATTAQAQSATSSYNYIGGGVSDEGLVINGKAQITPQFSIRPAAILNYDFDDATFLVPVTYDFAQVEAGEANLLPFAGAGVRIETDGDDNFGALVTGGVDYRITERWTANGSLNVSFINDTNFDFIVGVGYNF